MIAEPPSDVGALHEITACVFPGVALTSVGAPGMVRGVTAVDARDDAELPAALSATTVKVYEVPLANPEKVQERLAVFVQSAGAVMAGDEVTLYPVIDAPPFDVGALHESVACEFPGVAVTDVGAPGTVRGVTAAEGDDVIDSARALIATD